VGQDEDPLSPVRRPDVARRDTRPFRIEPERGKVGKHDTESIPIKAWDVLEEDEGRSAVSDNPSDVGPEPPLVIGAASLPGDAPGLAGESRSDDIHSSTPRCSVERGEVVPNRRAIQGRVIHPRHEDGRGVGVPLDVAKGAIAISEDHAEPEVQSADPGAKSQTTDHCSKAATRTKAAASHTAIETSLHIQDLTALAP